jgi:septal ring factor EnvC (AmiA/AmiB activator)
MREFSIAILKERYRTLSQIESLFPRNSTNKQLMSIKKEMDDTIKQLDDSKNDSVNVLTDVKILKSNLDALHCSIIELTNTIEVQQDALAKWREEPVGRLSQLLYAEGIQRHITELDELKCEYKEVLNQMIDSI